MRAHTRVGGVPVRSRRWLCKGGGGPASRAFPTQGQGGSNRRVSTSKMSKHAGDGGVPMGSWGGFAKGVGVLSAGFFQREDRGVPAGLPGVPTGKKNFSSGGGFRRRMGVPSEENCYNEKKNELNRTIWIVPLGSSGSLIKPPVRSLFDPIDRIGPKP